MYNGLLSSFLLSTANIELLQFSSGLPAAHFSSHVSMTEHIVQTCSAAVGTELLNLCRHIAGDQNFVLANGILAHNTYSIGGVSLDIDKSAKYQAMADGYDQQYEQMRELIKQSLKSVKGLSQSRYGIGISSALGPMTAPGSMSRRNFVGR
jgi:hypothetical protein